MQKIEASSPQAQSADLVGANIAQLKKLFPELLTENAHGVAVNVDVLKALVGDKTATDADEKYGLNWHGKRRARQLALTPSTGTLRPCPEESVDWETTQNLMIEGDNLEVLKLLQKSYAGKVKLIYIDPPYNTGKDFVYPDNFQDNIKNYLEITRQSEGGAKVSSNTEASGRFHTDWLNMMYPRLRLARNLLRDDGVIFVSIDDSEAANLKLLLSEVFGEENYIDTIAVEMSTTSGPKTVNAQQGTIVKNVEFVHIFRKTAEFDKVPHTPLLDGIEAYDTHYSAWLNEDKSIGTLVEAMLANIEVKAEIERYGFLERNYFNINKLSKLLLVSDVVKSFIENNKKKIARIDRSPISAGGSSTEIGRWITFEVDHRIYFLTTLANGKLQSLIPLSLNYRTSDDYKPRFGRTVIRGDLWKGFYQDMGNVAKEGEVPFSNGKKPIRLIKQLIKWADYSNDGMVLDFFAGSATTAHAVMQLNAESGGNKRFIMVQLPEALDITNSEQKAASELCDILNKPRTIAELTKERLRRAATKIRAVSAIQTGVTGQLSLEDAAEQPALTPAFSQREREPENQTPDLGFRVFKLDHSNIRAWNPQPADLEQAVIDYQDHLLAGRSESDILYELLLKLGLDLCVPIATRPLAGLDVHAVGGGVLLACLAPAIASTDVEALAQGIVAWHQELAPAGDTTCIFRDSAFADDVAKTNLTAILAQSGIENVRSL